MPYYKQVVENYPQSALKGQAAERLKGLQAQARPEAPAVVRPLK
jgi:hypothetical protein